jgi:hypothetical protein
MSSSAGRARVNSATVTFDFASDPGGDPRVASPAPHEDFQSDFRSELDQLDAWARQHRWPPRVVPGLQVSISAKYRISKSLVPAWYGETGRMQFALWRVAARKAAIAHELVHVFFPNGNRFLAEGLAVHLQAAIGGNPAFPNFGRPLHALAHALMQEMAPRPAGAHRVCLAELDQIATPGPLVLRVGQDFYGEDARGQAHLYPLAGSFVQFLIETRGLELFRELYRCTPLVPLTLNGGTPARWNDVYGLSLAALEVEWMSLLREYAEVALTPHSNLGN